EGSPRRPEAGAAADGASVAVPERRLGGPSAEAGMPGARSEAEPTLAAELSSQVDDEASHLHAEPCGIQERLAEAGRKLAANRVEAARQDLEEVLAADPSEPAAHALDGYLHDLQGETEAAIASYRAALYLDPALYQVRLLLADCLERSGWALRAGREYRQVLASLAGGADRSLVAFDDLLPDRRRAERRCRQALGQPA
ncbi:MAG TPA: hypothetical protein VHQ65_03730, partial [Thermoanaerobaculia bacterium]|nr:hypothetical protein [Thermoanaerobaculia bacterium]